MTTTDADLADITERNRIRQEAGLPLLRVSAELHRMEAAREEARFETEWTKRRPEFAAQWTGKRDSWITGMGRNSLARQTVRRENDD